MTTIFVKGGAIFLTKETAFLQLRLVFGIVFVRNAIFFVYLGFRLRYCTNSVTFQRNNAHHWS